MWVCMAFSLVVQLSASPAQRTLPFYMHHLTKRSFFGIQCKGVYDKSIYARLDRICEDCYNLFREPELHSLCKWVHIQNNDFCNESCLICSLSLNLVIATKFVSQGGVGKIILPRVCLRFLVWLPKKSVTLINNFMPSVSPNARSVLSLSFIFLLSSPHTFFHFLFFYKIASCNFLPLTIRSFGLHNSEDIHDVFIEWTFAKCFLPY